MLDLHKMYFVLCLTTTEISNPAVNVRSCSPMGEIVIAFCLGGVVSGRGGYRGAPCNCGFAWFEKVLRQEQGLSEGQMFAWKCI